ncbi:MAG: hypothetical protein MSG64_06535 [Pyrinomonadaceae bacterium MAG19_C2-C3]|nr:hypothetical protein [Pyrinomonadaceae bacterium MAG19_C2-C3]
MGMTIYNNDEYKTIVESLAAGTQRACELDGVWDAEKNPEWRADLYARLMAQTETNNAGFATADQFCRANGIAPEQFDRDYIYELHFLELGI